jgi:tetratricopeptide (TPR) repeat protein
MIALTLTCSAAGTALTAARVFAQAPVASDADLTEAERLFEAFDYEHAAPLLDRAIGALESGAPAPENRAALVRAYEMRARTRFGLGDRDGAVADFGSLLALDPGFTWSGQISPRVIALFDEVKKATIGSLALTIDPADAKLTLDGQAVSGVAELPLTAGDYTVSATRIGYKPVEQLVAVRAGEQTPLSLTLERTAAVVFLATAPAGVEIVIDGNSRGRTAAPAGAPADAGSEPLAVTDLTPGSHQVEFRRDCYVTERRPLAIDDLRDYRIEAVRLRQATASLSVQSSPSGASVFVDDVARGTTPAAIDAVCEGSRIVEIRGPEGRFVRRIEVKAGDRLTIDGRLKPAFALLPSGAGVVSAAGTTDARTLVERAVAPSDQVTVFVPTGPRLEQALEAQTMPPEWLAFDAGRRPVGGAATVTALARRQLSERVAKALDVQGVAAISQPSPTAPDLVIALLAAGAGEPDVVVVNPENADSVRSAIERFDYVPPMTRGTIGVLAIEAADVSGLVVARIDAHGAGERAGIKPGDTLMRGAGQPLENGAALVRLLDEFRGKSVEIDVIDVAGAPRTVQVDVESAPRLISVADESLLFNPLAVALRTRLAAAPAGEQPSVRLNLAVALMRLGDFAGAREQLEAVRLPAGRGIADGTLEYLRGLALDGLGDAAGAQRAWQAAAGSEASLTDDGPLVKGLAERRLAAGGTARAPSAP